MDETQGLVLAKAAGCQAGYAWGDPVIAARGVKSIRKGSYDWLELFPIVILREIPASWRLGLGDHQTVLGLEGNCLYRGVLEISTSLQGEVQVRFVQMYDAEAVDPT
jgi:hypothetical protein